MSKGPTEPEPEMIGVPVIEVPIELIENEYSKYEYLLPDNTTFSGWYDDFAFIMGYHLNSVDISNISSEIFLRKNNCLTTTVLVNSAPMYYIHNYTKL